MHGTVPAPFHTTIDYVATVRGRVGYAFDRFMPYVTGGVAWGHTHINVNDGDGVTSLFPVGHYQAGWTAGLGLEYAVSGNWTAKAEYEYVDLSRKTYDLSGFGLGSVNVDPRIHLFKLGLNYQFGDKPWMPAVADRKPSRSYQTIGSMLPRHIEGSRGICKILPRSVILLTGSGLVCS